MTPTVAFAHREDYLNKTFVYQTLDHKELELEYWVHYGSTSTSRTVLNAWQHTASFEYGILEHWMIEAFSTFQHLPGRNLDYLATHVETRVRLFDEGKKFLDPAFSLEYTHSNAEGVSVHSLEPTLVLSKDLQRLNFTLDLSLEHQLNAGHETEFGYAIATRYDTKHLFRIGAEAQGTFGHTTPHYLVPQIHLVLPSEVTAKVGVGFRFSGRVYRFLPGHPGP